MKPVIELLTKDGTIEKRLSSATVVNFSLKFGGGTGQIFVPKNTPDSNTETLQKFKRIAISLWNIDSEQYERAYVGVIEAADDVGNGFRVGLQPIHSIFKKRLTNENQNFSGDAGEEAQGLLDQTNIDDDTGITVGTEDVSEVINIDSNENQIFSTWNDIANEAGAEWDISPFGEFDFLQRLGEDKSSSIIIRHKISEQNRSTLSDYELKTEAKRMANRIIANNGIDRVVVEDSSSILKYGLLVEKVRIDAAPNITVLQTMAESLLEQKKEEIFDVVIVPIEKREVTSLNGKKRSIGLSFFEVSLGDDVRLVLEEGTHEIDETRRILEIKYKQVQNGSERIEMTLSKLGAKTTALEAVSSEVEREEIINRLRIIEGLI